MLACGLRQRADVPELLDGPLAPDAELDGNLDDLARINRWTGGQALVGIALGRLLPPRIRGFSFLDVGGGGGDGAAAVARWAARRGLACRAFLLDRSAAILALARSRQQGGAGLVRADGRALPLPDGGVDVAACSLVLHHLTSADALTVLRELRRVARRGVILDDLVRSRVGLAGAALLGAVATRNRLTRHDAPLSVRRAFTAAELRRLAAAASLAPRWQGAIPGYRLVLALTAAGG